MDGFFNGLHRELTKAVADFPKVGRTIDRHDYLFLLDQLVSEYNHFVMLADILEHVQKRKLTKRDLRQLPQEKKLGDIRPETLGQAGRIPGVTPAAISLLMIYLKKHQHQQKAAQQA